jgi:serine acetyltransferase
MTSLGSIDHLLATIAMRTQLPLARMHIRATGARCARSVRAIGFPIVNCFRGSTLSIEEDVVLCSWSRWTALGVSHPVVLRTLREGARLRIGRGTGISGGSFCAAVDIDIGTSCMIGSDVIVSDTDFHARDAIARRGRDDWSRIESRPVRIGNDVFIGARATILKGVEIGDGAIVGAGAVVTRSVAPGTVVAGNPAVRVGLC